jgi:hypothetical protein
MTLMLKPLMKRIEYSWALSIAKAEFIGKYPELQTHLQGINIFYMTKRGTQKGKQVFSAMVYLAHVLSKCSCIEQKGEVLVS